jgi:hypothetical protein
MGNPYQPDLFTAGGRSVEAGGGPPPPPAAAPELGQELLIDWQRRVARLQARCHGAMGPGPGGDQLTLLPPAGSTADPGARAAAIDPFALTPQNLAFWRWPSPPHGGAAIYFVVDRPPHLDDPLLLYVGETGRAEQRWKGEHDCKSYLAAYGEALQRAGLGRRTSIRFWSDVPAAVRPRRALEKALIQRWLPPFNKETRERWATPFTTDPC